MKKILVFLFALFFIFSNLSAQNNDCGLLLGIKTSNQYQTFWIARIQDTVSITVVGNYLVLPQKERFLKVGVKRSHYNDWTEDFLWAMSIQDNESQREYPFIRGIDPRKVEALHNFGRNLSFEIDFLHDNLVSLDRFEGAWGAFIEDHSSLFVQNVDSLLTLRFTELGVLTKIELSNYLDSTNLQPSKGAVDSSGRISHFGVVRENGKWALKRRLDPISRRGYDFKDSVFSFTLPKSLVGYDDLYPSWEAMKKEISNIKDAFSSPAKNMTVVLTDSMFFVYDFSNSKFKKLLSSRKLLKNERAVMAEWATGNNVLRWNKIIEAIIKQRKEKGAYVTPFD